MRRVAYTAILAIPFALAAAAPAAAQTAPFTGAHVDGIIGWDRLQNNGHNDDIMYGLNAGYDFGTRSGTIFGVEAEIADSNNKSCYGAETVADPRVCAKAARDIYVGGRIGKVITPRTMIYAKAGYTNARVKLTSDDGTGQTTLGHSDLDGIRLGVGAEYALSPNSFVKAEYRYSNYEKGFSRNQLLTGIGFRF
ncbi:MAG TPA: porin family protein [Sphingomonas sp.]|nr:porin family protein [Sphingomonas sp.]